jgi:hypothetical protein
MKNLDAVRMCIGHGGRAPCISKYGNKNSCKRSVLPLRILLSDTHLGVRLGATQGRSGHGSD